MNGYLHRFNPLAKLAATAPAMIALGFVRDMATPAAFLAVAYGLLLTGARPSRRLYAVLGLVVPAMIVVLGASMALWIDARRVADTAAVVTVGSWTLYSGALSLGYATALRIGAIVALALVSGLTTTAADLVRAMITHLRVPYRVGYAMLAGTRLVARFGAELASIKRAHRVRGAVAGRGPFAALARQLGYVVPLLAGAIRHGERMAIAMDARAFGAYPTRTERQVLEFRKRDIVLIALLWAISVALILAA